MLDQEQEDQPEGRIKASSKASQKSRRGQKARRGEELED